MPSSLAGSRIRRGGVVLGRVVEEDDRGLVVSRGSLLLDPDVLPRDCLEDVEVFTQDRGWVPVLREMVELKYGSGKFSELLTELKQVLDEAGRHYPFKRKSHLGPGPRGRSMDQAGKWKCKCSNYVCQCRGKKGRRKTIRIDPGYKASYNQEYRAWRAGRED